MRLWRPEGKRVEIEAIETALVDLPARFNLSCIAADPWQAAYLIERLHKRGLPTVPIDFTGSNLRSMATAVLEAFGER